MVKRDFRRSKHFNIRGEFREWILIDLKLGILCLEAPEDNLLLGLLNDVAQLPVGILQFTTKGLKLLGTFRSTLGSHGSHILGYGCLITCLFCLCLDLLDTTEGQIEFQI
ncbi:hypothetical protein BHE74_00020455 [Ensete ventricosum]|nr:hypothetical protein GW17_00055573 [Ensete ventricosum]RWW71783.1 hypothetical protein BHE74_00020455 [Ensete ventricosum]